MPVSPALGWPEHPVQNSATGRCGRQAEQAQVACQAAAPQALPLPCAPLSAWQLHWLLPCGRLGRPVQGFLLGTAEVTVAEVSRLVQVPRTARL